MTIYLALCDDRHCDMTIRPFRTEAAARAQCDAWLADLPEYTKPHEKATFPGWLYYVGYGNGDSVRVEAQELDDEVQP